MIIDPCVCCFSYIKSFFLFFFFFFNFMALFYGWGSTASRLESHFEEAVYLLSLSYQKFLVLISSTSAGWKAESTLEPLIGFEHGTPGLKFYCPRTLTWLCEGYDCIVFTYNCMFLSSHMRVLEWVHTL